MPFVTLANDVRIYYEFTGPEDRPTILQFGGSLFGRHNFNSVNDGFREHFRCCPSTPRATGAPTSR